MFGRKKSSPAASPSSTPKGVPVTTRGEQESTQQRFNAEVYVPEAQVWEQDTVARAVEAAHDIERGDYRLDSWNRSDGSGGLYKRGR